MPSHTPRNQPTRKKEQLLNCSEYLRLAIFHNKSQVQIEKHVEKYRLANISLLKAKIHVLRTDQAYPNVNAIQKIDKLEQVMSNWQQYESEKIISEFKR